MKKIIILFLVTLILVGGAGHISAAGHNSDVITKENNIDMRVGFDLPTIGWANYNDEGQLKGWRGANIAFGYSQINYFEPAKMDEFNPFWEWGTLAVIVPYVGIGGEYPMEIDDGENYMSFTGGVGLYGARIGASYAW